MAGTTAGRWWRRIAWSSAAVVGCVAANPAYDFAYRLSGDRRVAPIQVFDDGRQTWLQFAPGQVLPAVFAGPDETSMTLARHAQQGPYLVLEGTAGRIELRIGEIIARADYAGSQARAWSPSSEPAIGGLIGSGTVLGLAEARQRLPTARTSPGSAAAVQRVAMSEGSAAASALATPLSAVAVVPASTQASRVAAPSEPSPSAGSTVPTQVALVTPRMADDGRAMLEFDAAIADGNMRRVLERWARQAGWLFQAEHWAVDVDIPLVGAAAFGPDFRNAVRGLLGSTELGERPLQPCFYANRVLRVIPLAQACDRTLAPTVAVRGLS